MTATSTSKDKKDPFRNAIEDIVDTYHILKQYEKNPPYWIATIPTAYKLIQPVVSGLPAQLLNAIPNHFIKERYYMQQCFFTPEMKKDFETTTQDLESVISMPK